MALKDFWINVRTAFNLHASKPIADAPRLDSETIEQTLRQSTLWLTPAAVAGFDGRDFDFLPDDERARLAILVADFRAVAATVKRRTHAPSDAVETALPMFKGIIELLEFDRYADPEAFKLGKQIEREVESDRPLELGELRFRTGLDHTGDPGLWIWVFLTDEASETDEQFLQGVDSLEGYLDPIARQVAPERFPYFWFRSLSDQSAPVEEE